ncbi:aminoglycoside N(3)-acetyltransferase [Streptomyces sp. NPDC007901]|uniref:aminoglycoside N(3)-acetyltransferase n=1 Tax=Streptomyces sp. NPDC007901 TaxID=3364785 RepID=UPI0036DFED80
MADRPGVPEPPHASAASTATASAIAASATAASTASVTAASAIATAASATAASTASVTTASAIATAASATAAPTASVTIASAIATAASASAPATVTAATGPITAAGVARKAELDRLAELFRSLGVRRGGVLMVHASLSGTGVAPELVRDALLAVLGPAGTLIVPAFTPENSDTSRAYKEAVAELSGPEAAEYRRGMPPFEPDATACPTMGALAECVRSTPGAVRSAHPQTSLAGLGARAGKLLRRHPLRSHLGRLSPMARLYRADAQILLLRVGFEVCSAFHYAEYLMRPRPSRRTYRCVVGGKGNWVEYRDLELDDSDFGVIGSRLPRRLLAETEWASGTVVLCGMRDVVGDAKRQMSRYRRALA